jgi:hypothetical protein
MDVAADHERDRRAGGDSAVEHVDTGEVLGVLCMGPDYAAGGARGAVGGHFWPGRWDIIVVCQRLERKASSGSAGR